MPRESRRTLCKDARHSGRQTKGSICVVRNVRILEGRVQTLLIQNIRYYTYYSLNGQTTLPVPKDNDRYPDVKILTVRDFFAGTRMEDIGKRSFF